jgi:hypothetical protein
MLRPIDELRRAGGKCQLRSGVAHVLRIGVAHEVRIGLLTCYGSGLLTCYGSGLLTCYGSGLLTCYGSGEPAAPRPRSLLRSFLATHSLPGRPPATSWPRSYGLFSRTRLSPGRGRTSNTSQAPVAKRAGVVTSGCPSALGGRRPARNPTQLRLTQRAPVRLASVRRTRAGPRTGQDAPRDRAPVRLAKAAYGRTARTGAASSSRGVAPEVSA